ncbi:DUF6614 family protein [Allosediminivita pacifica]|uniref:Uncharacterized protein n=1 Tax=Allosediminivita pacifica TaxID=1267769 RepID=A0A2T6AY92_9RHOB|nr:DUF6614 family protein [Allosediminivita pacifica]PTX48780.1 hypothetical protein C8N44_10858 [Allosediminivita pacifica]GGB08167.1 hypothetical protein GCM10011324_17920 [Allosediminivita pacifica]
MNLYTCSIELKKEAKSLVFAKALAEWMDLLKSRDVIVDWHLYRRKLGLSSDRHTDFLLNIEVEDMGQLDRAFRTLVQPDEEIEQLYNAVHNQIVTADVGLYRRFPDPERAERVAFF